LKASALKLVIGFGKNNIIGIDMFTVIVPTMWKFEPFVQFLEDLTSAAPVNEILVINNNKQETPNHPVLNHPMINQIIPENNMFVNPAWNINDDLIFDLKVFHRMWPHISPERGVYGISAGNVEMGQEPVTTGEIFVRHCTTPYHNVTHFGFGQFMMFNKNNYTPIIDGLDIYWGDNFIYDTMYYKMNQNYQITNMFHYTPYASTVTKIPDHNEHRIYNEVMPQFFNRIRVENANRTGFY
jgi:hypothetical protein